MKIEYLGHSAFRLISAAGKSVVTDPYGGVGFDMPRVSADIVTISHGHFDHNNVAAVDAPTCLSAAGAYHFCGMEIEAIESFHDEVQGKKRGQNLIFRFLIDGMRICHFGDLGESCLPELVEKIAPIDVLLLPVGGNYTIDAAEAKCYVEALRPSIVIPMHYKTAGLNVNVEGPERFLSYFEDVEHAESEIEIHQTDLSTKTKIILMEQRR